jgi:tetratricopeptide (TPR) repeat protein
MTFIDAWALPLSTTSADAAHCFNDGLDRLLAGLEGPARRFRDAVAADPNFALAHLALAQTLQASGRGTDASASRERARVLAAATTARERQLTEISCMLSGGDPDDALGAARQHLAEFPCDVLLLGQVINHIFFHGRWGKKQAVLELLDSLAAAWGDDWWFGSRYAFHLLEAGAVDRARAVAERSFAIRAAHTLAHVMYQERQAGEAHAFLSAWLKEHPDEGGLHGHLWWHVSQLELDLGHPEQAWEAYQRHTRPEISPGPKALVLADSAGFLWRTHLGSSRSLQRDAWREAHALATTLTRTPGKPFVDFHAALAFAGAQDTERLAGLVKALEVSPDPFSRRVTTRLTHSIAAFARADFRGTVSALEALTPADIEGIGGSDFERALVGETLNEAERRLYQSPQA